MTILKIAIINYSGKRWPFDSTYKSSILSQDDLTNIISILIICVTD